MGKFASDQVRAATQSPITTTTQDLTHEGGTGFDRDPRSELFLLGVSNLVREDNFYEAAAKRDDRFVRLVWEITKTDPDWVRSFLPWLRTSMFLRSAPVVGAAEYVAAGGPNGRSLVDAVLQRAEEPAEMLAYWVQAHGRNVPKPVKRGVADAAARLYTEFSALKYDSSRSAWRMGDVIELTHPTPKAPWQGELFRWLLDAGKGRERIEIGESLTMIRARAAMNSLPVESRRALVNDSGYLKTAGMTWESLSGWLEGPMDAEAWTAVIPQMGYMALLRNLRNFEEAGVDAEVLAAVAALLADPEQVAKSKQLPIRFLSAWLASQSMTFGPALEAACNLSVDNVPSLPGRTLILIDCSGSMWSSLSGRSKAQRYQVAGVFGLALAKRAEDATAVVFGTNSQELPKMKGSILRAAEKLPDLGGTYTWKAVADHYKGHDRVIILTDEQAHDSHHGMFDAIPALYTFNIGGYRVAHTEERSGWHTFGGGLTDAAFRLLPALEAQRNVGWPWE